MRFSLQILFAFVFFAVSCYSQNAENILAQSPDSSLRFQGIIPPVEYQYDISELYITPLFNQIPDEILFDENSSTVWLRTEILFSNKNLSTENCEIKTHFTSPLYQQYLKDSEFDMVSYILGTVQTGAVAYMAYRHIKKYGFWK